MSTHSGEFSANLNAKLAGVGLLLMTLLAIFAEFMVRQDLIVVSNTGTTITNLIEHESLFRLAIASYGLIAILDILVAWALYLLLKPGHQGLALLMMALRLLYAAVLLVATAQLLSTATLLDGTSLNLATVNMLLHAQVKLLLTNFDTIWNLGLLIFGLHLGVLGYLLWQRRIMPRIIAALVIVAGAGYVADSMGVIVVADYTAVVSQFTFIGELLLMFWLLIKRYPSTSAA